MVSNSGNTEAALLNPEVLTNTRPGPDAALMAAVNAAESPGKASDAGALAVTFDAMLTAAGTLWRVLRSDGLVLDSDEHGFCTPDTVDRGGYCFVSREWAERHLKRWNKKQAKGEQSDAAVRPDPFDGGCPDDSERVADAGNSTRASGAPLVPSPASLPSSTDLAWSIGFAHAMVVACGIVSELAPSDAARACRVRLMEESQKRTARGAVIECRA